MSGDRGQHAADRDRRAGVIAALIMVPLAPLAWAAGKAMDAWDRLTAGRERTGKR